jgi:hypothetical protein
LLGILAGDCVSNIRRETLTRARRDGIRRKTRARLTV